MALKRYMMRAVTAKAVLFKMVLDWFPVDVKFYLKKVFCFFFDFNFCFKDYLFLVKYWHLLFSDLQILDLMIYCYLQILVHR